MRMAEWVQKLDAFLQFNEYEVLTNAGRVSRKSQGARRSEYEKFRVCRTATSRATSSARRGG